MATFTSTLSDDLLEKLAYHAGRLSVPKNKLIEKALSMYLEHLKRAEYVKSYKQAAQDEDTLLLAEEGMVEYLSQIENETR